MNQNDLWLNEFGQTNKAYDFAGRKSTRKSMEQTQYLRGILITYYRYQKMARIVSRTCRLSAGKLTS